MISSTYPIITETINTILWTVIDPIPSEFEEWQEKHKLNTAYCGYFKTRENPKVGINNYIQNFCGESDCPYCGPRIREEMRRALEWTVEKKPLRLVKLTGKNAKKERAALIRKYGGKEKVSSFVNDIITDHGLEYEIELLIDTEDEIGEEYLEVKTEDVERWSRKAFSGKKSGNLHRLHKASITASSSNNNPDPESEKVRCEEWQLDTKDKNLLRQIESEVVEETKNLEPQTIDELERAMVIRRELRREKLEENNIVILGNTVFYITVRMSEVDWGLAKTKSKRE